MILYHHDMRSVVSTAALFAISIFVIACGTSMLVQPDAAPPDAGPQILWTYGGGKDDVRSVVESRSGTLYVGVRHTVDASTAQTSFVAALDHDGHEIWRTPIPEPADFDLTANGAGELWAQGALLTHLDVSGAIVWSAPLPAGLWESDAVALARDGTYFHFVGTELGGAPTQALEAVAPDGTARWSTPVGGFTAGDQSWIPTRLQRPVVDASGHVDVTCQPCSDGRNGIAQLDPTTGALLDVIVVPSASGNSMFCDGIVVDARGNLYFGTGVLSGLLGISHDGLASSASGGALRWTSAYRSEVALVGSQSIVVSGFVELSPNDGSVVASATVPDPVAPGYGQLKALVSGSLDLVEASFDGYLPYGTAIADAQATLIWDDAAMDAATAIPDVGRVYGIERDKARHGTLVAVQAPISGLEQSAWPMFRHDPGHTSSALGSW